MRREKMALLLVCLHAAIAAFLLPHGVSADGECGKVKCGMGTCSESSDYIFGFACQCNIGWSRYHLGDMQFPFLPCVIPNCTIKNSCQDGSSPPPVPSSPPPPSLTNFSIFDPCLMQYCGDGGACEKASDFTHQCSCRDGYTNLLNDSSYPCYRQCSLRTDCKGQGIDVINGSTPSSSPPAPVSSVVINGSTPSSSPPAPVSFVVNKSGAAAPAGRLLELLALVSFVWVQAIW